MIRICQVPCSEPRPIIFVDIVRDFPHSLQQIQDRYFTVGHDTVTTSTTIRYTTSRQRNVEIAHIHLVQILRMHGAVLHLPPTY